MRKKKTVPPQSSSPPQESASIHISDIDIAWQRSRGVCTFQGLPVAMMWIDSTLTGLMAGVQSMIGTKRFFLALQSEGRKSVKADWQVIARSEDFPEGFRAIANIAAVAGWGDWELVSLDMEKKRASFEIRDSWEGRYQKTLGVCWGSGMMAGKLSGYCSQLFGCNCWADQTQFIAQGHPCDAFMVQPSIRSLEKEIEDLLLTDEATRADMAVALEKLQNEVRERSRSDHLLRTQYRLAVALNESTDLIEAVDALLSSAFELDGVDCGGVYLVDRFTGEISLIHHRGLNEIFIQQNSRYASDSPNATVVQRGVPLFSRYEQLLPLMDEANRSEGLKALAVVPIRYSGQVVACLNLGSHSLDDFPEPARQAVVALAAQTGGVIARKMSEEERRVLETQMKHAQKLESLGVLAGGIAHDFNNLLMGMLGNADLALQDLAENDPARESVLGIATSCRRAADLCRQMLAYSGKGRFIIEHVSLSEIVLEMAELLEISISKKVHLDLQLCSPLPPIKADTTQLRQVIMNLITNASEAIGDRNGRISLRTGILSCDHAYLKESYLDDDLTPGPYVFLEVSDNGCGMDENIKSKVFDPFFSTKFTGRGLGLSAVLGIVRGHRGALKLYSEPGKGSTFKVLFPAEEEPPVSVVQAAKPAAPPRKRSGTVLLIDDEPAVLQVGRRYLERLGFEVISARDGKEGLDLFCQQAASIACVILDLTMPHMNGEECFSEMRRLHPEVPVILSSGYNEQEVTQRFVGRGLAGFIQKPYMLATLSEKLDEVLRVMGEG